MTTKLFALMCVKPDGLRTIFGANDNGILPMPCVVTLRPIIERMMEKLKPLMRDVAKKHNVTFELVEFHVAKSEPIKL